METLNRSTHNVVDIFTGNAIFLHPLFKEVNSQFQTKVLFLQLCDLLQMYTVTIYGFNNQLIYVCATVPVYVYHMKSCQNVAKLCHVSKLDF